MSENNESKTYKYKTVLCKKWKVAGKCPYNNLCLFAHGASDLLKPGEFDERKKKEEQKKEEQKEERRQKEQQEERKEEQRQKIKKQFPLNPNAKIFKIRRNSIELQVENIEYEEYWKVIHRIILDSCEQERREKIILPPPGYKRIYLPKNFHPPYLHFHPGKYGICLHTDCVESREFFSKR